MDILNSNILINLNQFCSQIEIQRIKLYKKIISQTSLTLLISGLCNQSHDHYLILLIITIPRSSVPFDHQGRAIIIQLMYTSCTSCVEMKYTIFVDINFAACAGKQSHTRFL